MKNKTLTVLLAGLAGFAALPELAAESFMVEDGKPTAEIVIADNPPRMTQLAAEELRDHVKKMSGAELPIVTAPTESVPVRIYVGESEFTKKLNLNVEGLEYGAFKIVAGDDWLALLGVDEDFVPPEPWARHHGYIKQMNEKWDELTKDRTEFGWTCPMGGLYRQRNGKIGWWAHDKHGSLNAVYQFLRDVGVRWYMPGELGEIVPEMRTIPLPSETKTVKPAFPIRKMTFSLYASSSREDILWYMRLGLNQGEEIIGLRGGYAHGLREVMSREKMAKEKPEWFAVWNGKRRTGEGGIREKPCLSADGLVKETANYVRAMFDVYDAPMVSIMPQDGYGHPCECELCRKAGLETPERGFNGRISDYVWNFVVRVAKEVAKTHPDKKISCFAYGGYFLPPETIDKLPPNVVVGMVHGRSGHVRDPEVGKRVDEIRRRWSELSSNPLIMWEHYPFTNRGTFQPAYFPHQIGKNLRKLKGVSMGEFVETPVGPFKERGHGLHSPGINNLNVHVTARCYWDPDRDVDELLDEYYHKFYGPAADGMKAFIEYSEANWRDMKGDPEKIAKCLDLFDAAKAKVAADSVHGKRIALVDDYLLQLRNLGRQLAKGRDDAPAIRHLRAPRRPKIKVDGEFDDYLGIHPVSNHSLREVETGRFPVYPTTFKVVWLPDALYLAIHCEDRKGTPLNAPDSKKDDPAILEGDHVEVLLETQSHSHYQIAVSPNGAVFDADRQGGANAVEWDSDVEVATKVGDGFWDVEMRIPVAIGDVAGDPLHDVVGRRPMETFPWYINVCRARSRESGDERSAFSPTGSATFHDPMKFGKLP